MIYLNQNKHIGGILRQFEMVESKLVQITPFMTNCKLSKDTCPQNDVDLEGMLTILFQNVIGSLMYAMVCIKLDMAHAMGVVSQFMASLGYHIR
jgi:ATP-binding cassette subfamily B (MDR/TAP) protein 1